MCVDNSVEGQFVPCMCKMLSHDNAKLSPKVTILMCEPPFSIYIQTPVFIQVCIPNRQSNYKGCKIHEQLGCAIDQLSQMPPSTQCPIQCCSLIIYRWEISASKSTYWLREWPFDIYVGARRSPVKQIFFPAFQRSKFL